MKKFASLAVIASSLFMGITALPAGATTQPASESPASATKVSSPPSASAIGLLRNGNSGKCLVARGDADNAPAVQFTCGDFRDQYWSVVSIGGNQYRVVNANSGKCLLVRGTADNAPVVQHTCLSFADQYWRLIDKGTMVQLQNVNSGKCLLVRGHGENAPAVQFSCLNFPDQYWF